jgi:RNA polymerase sigma-70 factor (ECF subfamily)
MSGSNSAWVGRSPLSAALGADAGGGLVDVAGAHAAGRAAHPGVDVPADAFTAYLTERGFGAEGVATGRAADLYLCCACLRRDGRALAAFDALLVASATPALVRMGLASEARDEVAQALREKLFVGRAGPAKLAEYAGRGALASWLRAAAVRTALNGLRDRGRRASLGDDDWLAWPSPGDDPEVAALKRAFGADFRAAFSGALASLEPRARLLLRQHLLDGLGHEQLGALYGVHSVTAYRWLRDARSSLVKETRARLAAGRRVRAEELDSLLRLLESQLDASVTRLLAEG